MAMTDQAPAGLKDAVAAVQRTGANVIGHSHHGERPNCSEPGEWWINVDFPRDNTGWEILDKLTQAIHTPPPGADDVSELITFDVWSDAGLRFTISGAAGSDPYMLASTIDRTLAQWDNGW